MQATPADTLVLRSEYEKAGDELLDINCPLEGRVNYQITAGNQDGYYAINSSNGKISIATEIPDSYGVVRTDRLTVTAGNYTYNITIADGYDYFVQHLPPGYTVMSGDGDLYSDPSSEWTVYNNLWGKGTAVPDKDFRIATIHKATLPDTTYIMWDVPGNPETAAVWCYVNVFWGNRKNMRENLKGFPFVIGSKPNLTLDFDFQQRFGNDNFKIAMNMFMTNETKLSPFSANVGDLFFIFDQKGTYIPPYPYSLPDKTILGKQFALRYDDKADDGSTYERRRIIVKNNEKVLAGKLDIKGIFDLFSAAGYLNTQQSIYHIQLGIEVTNGFGAVAFNKFNISTTASTGLQATNLTQGRAYPNPVTDKLTIEGTTKDERFIVTDVAGRNISVTTFPVAADKTTVDCSALKPGMYLVRCSSGTYKIRKQ